MMKVTSWGRYPGTIQNLNALEWRSELSSLVHENMSNCQFLPYGMGRSYGDSCLALSNEVIGCRGIRKFISADWVNGIVRLESGVTLQELIEVAVPQGWFLPVTPGTKFVTIGGAIANDVHGKNHHKVGTFGRFVKRFSLFRSDGNQLECSSDNNQSLYSATIGGLGLTGIITEATIQLVKINSSQIEQKVIKFEGLDEFFSLSAKYDEDYEYTVSWIDCLSGKDLKGHFILGNHACNGPLHVEDKSNFQLPIVPPCSLVNRWTLKPFNYLYYNKIRSREVSSTVQYDTFFYPLDRLLHWNRMYGPKGFQQYQCVVDFEYSYDAIKEMLEEIKSVNMGSFLAVLKICGEIASPGLLSFPKPGVSLALDFPVNRRNASLFERLNQIVLAANGRLYPAKDSAMSAEFFKHTYPRWEELESVRDPRIISAFWHRVTG